MFRYPELDCYQTMLKRLYKKEVEQVVLWFEEYRSALSMDLGRQEQIIYEEHYGSSQPDSVQNKQPILTAQNPHPISTTPPQQQQKIPNRVFNPQSDYVNIQKTNV